MSNSTTPREPRTGSAIERAREHIAAAETRRSLLARDTADSVDTVGGHPAGVPELAVVTGNRAGVVEWASPGWTRITGLPLAETVAKPILHFLERGEIEEALVEYVGRRFLEGQRSSVQFPFESAQGAEVRIHLEVEPLRDEQGEVAEFVAFAHEIESPGPVAGDRPPPNPSANADGSPGRATQRPCGAGSSARVAAGAGRAPTTELSAVIRRALATTIQVAPPNLQFDLDLPDDLEPLAIDPEQLDRLLQTLVTAACEAVGEQAGFVTVLAGRSPARRSHVSAAYPVPARPPELRRGPQIHLEVHDTGRALTRDALDRLRHAKPPRSSRERRLLGARRLAERLGATLHVDSRPGCGNQSLLLFPLGPEAPVMPRR